MADKIKNKRVTVTIEISESELDYIMTTGWLPSESHPHIVNSFVEKTCKGQAIIVDS